MAGTHLRRGAQLEIASCTPGTPEPLATAVLFCLRSAGVPLMQAANLRN